MRAFLQRSAFFFVATIFLSAFLLFQVQPILGRYVLPWFGGGPTVWTDCLLFFQTLLVGGYAYAHWLGSRRSLRLQTVLHIALLAASLLFLPLDPRGLLAKEASSAEPSARILLVLAATVTGPYLMLSATGPLLQRWFTMRFPGRSPWRLYALSNFGSFLALLSYPFLVEPVFTLRAQSRAWSALYGLFVLICGATGFSLIKAQYAPVAATKRPALSDSLYWIALAATGSVLLLATTNFICQDVAVVPFLWIAPLSVYLLTFVLAFDSSRWYHRAAFAVAAGILVPGACAVMAAAVSIDPPWQVAVALGALFVTCMICHGELARSRPSEQNLTSFYVMIAGGGALGGVFVALICPHIFTQFSEYPIGLAAACLLGLTGWFRSGAFRQWTSRNFAVRVPLMALLIGGLTSITVVASSNRPALATVRNFFGILRVSENLDLANGPYRELTHGRIRHGFQYLRSPQNSWPTTYYGPHSGIGIALQSLEGPRRVGVIGLGTGTLAAWGRPGDTFRFYEINPDVIAVANTWFSYLKNSRARTEIVLGDARVELERELEAGHAQRFDILAVDAFSSDAIPLHLLTTECGDLYRKHLAPGGLLLFHISNRFLRLDPVTRGLARHLGWSATLFLSPGDEATGESPARWVLLTDNQNFLERSGMLARASRWGKQQPAPITWTDDFASLWQVLKY